MTAVPEVAPAATAGADEPGPLRVRPEPEAVEFAESVRRLLEQYAGRDALRAAWDAPSGRIDGLWRRLAETGAAGLVVPEAAGGLGLDLTATLPLLAEAGRAALPEPLAATIAGSWLLRRCATSSDARRWLPAIAEGGATVGLGLAGEPDRPVLGGAWADLVVLPTPDGGRVRAVPVEDATRRAVPAADPGAGLATLTAHDAAGVVLPGVTADDLIDVACVVAAGELVGLSAALLDLAVGYAKTRRQFGRPIGGFQAVKHHLANVYVQNAFAVPVVARAAWSVATATATAHRDASHAMFAVGTAARLAARTALQVHGGIGYTYEHDLHMWQKRVWTLTSVFGDPARHRRRVSDIVMGEH